MEGGGSGDHTNSGFPRRPAITHRFGPRLNRSPVAAIRFSDRLLERLIATCMDAVYDLSVSGEDNERKMKIVAIEYRARLLLERFKKLAVN